MVNKIKIGTIKEKDFQINITNGKAETRRLETKYSIL